MTTTSGHWATPKASQYLQTLCKHFGHMVETRFDERQGTIAFPGSSVRLLATATELLVAAEGTTPETAARVRGVIDSHLKRFAFREGFEAMDWADTEETPDWLVDRAAALAGEQSCPGAHARPDQPRLCLHQVRQRAGFLTCP